MAIVDDIGAILVIAVVYTSDIQVDSLALAVVGLIAVHTMYRIGVNSIPLYFLIGGIVWSAVFESGIHATIAGVVLGLMTPLDPLPVTIGRRFQRLLGNPETVGTPNIALSDAGPEDREAGPLYRLEHQLHPFTSLLIVPLFALANAGVSLDPATIRESVTTSVTAGVAFGLLVGKPLGIVVISWLAVRARVSPLPEGTNWVQLLGAGMLAGIGFTVALFINGLAFESEVMVERGKIGIMGGSLVAGVLGFLLLRVSSNTPGQD